jgi:hypothetical protein
MRGQGQAAKMQVGTVNVQTTSNRGFTPEEWADMCLEKIIYVGDQAIPAVRDQAIAYRANIKSVLVDYMTKAIQSDRTTLYNLLLQQGHGDMAEIIRKQL